MPVKNNQKSSGTWKEIISDKNKFPDDFALSMSDGNTLTLGELRAANDETNGAVLQQLTEREQKLAAGEGQLRSAQSVVAQLYERAMKLMPADDKGGDGTDGKPKNKQQARTVIVDGEELDPNDPIFGPVARRISQLESQISDMSKADKAELNNLKTALGQALKINLQDHYDLQFERLLPGLPEKARKDLTLEKMIKHAQDNGHVDRAGRFDLRKSAKDIAAPFLEEERMTAAEQRGYKKAQDEQRVANIPRPGGAPHKPAQTFFKKDGTVKSFDDVFADALQDTEIQSIISGAVGGSA